MHTLILLRHAKAVRDHEAPDDRSRVLTERGRAEAAEAGRRLARLAPSIDLALVSPSARTRETADLALPSLTPRPRLEIRETLYHAPPETLFAEAQDGGAGVVLVVAHNPGLEALVADLIRQAGDASALARRTAARFPTAAFAAFAIEGDVLDAAGPRLIAAWSPGEA